MNSDVQKYANGESPLARLCGDNNKRPMRVSPMPGERFGNAPVGIWCLTDFETRQAQIEAIKYLSEALKVTDSQFVNDTWLADAEFKTQILFKSLRDPSEPLRPFAGSANEVRTRLYPDEREALYNEYLSFVDERSPLRKIKSREELEELITALGKSGQTETILSYYDIASLRTTVLELGALCAKLTKESCSGTSVLSESLAKAHNHTSTEQPD